MTLSGGGVWLGAEAGCGSEGRRRAAARAGGGAPTGRYIRNRSEVSQCLGPEISQRLSCSQANGNTCTRETAARAKTVRLFSRPAAPAGLVLPGWASRGRAREPAGRRPRGVGP